MSDMILPSEILINNCDVIRGYLFEKGRPYEN